MITLTGSIKNDTVVLTDAALKVFDGQTVTFILEEKSEDFLKNRLEQLRTQSISTWGEDAQKYLEKLRSE